MDSSINGLTEALHQSAEKLTICKYGLLEQNILTSSVGTPFELRPRIDA
jgi:hypothetical protein